MLTNSSSFATALKLRNEAAQQGWYLCQLFYSDSWVRCMRIRFWFFSSACHHLEKDFFPLVISSWLFKSDFRTKRSEKAEHSWLLHGHFSVVLLFPGIVEGNFQESGRIFELYQNTPFVVGTPAETFEARGRTDCLLRCAQLHHVKPHLRNFLIYLKAVALFPVQWFSRKTRFNVALFQCVGALTAEGNCSLVTSDLDSMRTLLVPVLGGAFENYRFFCDAANPGDGKWASSVPFSPFVFWLSLW